MSKLTGIDATRRLISFIVISAIALVAYIVIIGGLISYRERAYTFDEYIGDVRGVYKILLTALFGAIAHALVPLFDRLGRNGKT